MKQSALVLLVATALLWSCGSKKKAKDSPDSNSDKSQPAGDSPLGSLGLMGSLLGSRLDEPGPYNEPRKSKGFDDDEDHFAVLEIGGAIVELEGFSWFGGFSGVELRAITDRLRQLGSDSSVAGVVLRVGDLNVDMATAEELRAALVAFKTAGGRQRKLVCHTEVVFTTTYYVLTACDSIGLAPTGEVVISGVTAISLHIKGLLDKIGVRADFMHIGAFKGAAEPLTRDQPSPEMIKTLDTIMDQAFATLVSGIAEGRKLDPKNVRALVDTAVFQGEAALSARLVDVIAIYESYRDTELQGAEWTAVKLTDGKKMDLTNLMRFVGIMPRARPTKPHVAVVYAVGNVVDGQGMGALGARQEIASRTLAAAFRALARDDLVKAIVFRIDSGGGSALASEIIWHAVAEAKKVKPVIVSMANVAASGGYYIGCGATKVFASENTLTGSIGVVGGKLAIEGAMGKIGVTAYPMGRGKRALMWSSFGSWSPDERDAVRGMMEGTYKAFVTRVAEGRGKSYDEIDAIAQGRVWTGAGALKNGLIDEIGGFDAALAEARQQAGVKAEVELEVYPPKPTLIEIVSSLGQMGSPFGVDLVVAQVASDLGVAEAEVVEDLLGQLLMFRETPVLASWFFPAVIR